MNCPQCSSETYDNRAENQQRAAKGEKLRPQFKCKACDWVQWPPKGNIAKTVTQVVQQAAVRDLDLEAYDHPLPGKHDGGISKLQPQGTGSHRGNPDWMDELFHIYAACWPEAAQYSTDPGVQASVAATLFIAAIKAKQ